MAAKGKKLTGTALVRARTNIKKAQAALKRKFAGKKPKSAKNKRKSNPKKSMAKTKAKTVIRHKHSKLMSFIKGGFGGAGVGETAGVALDVTGIPPIISIPVRLGTSAVGGYYIGDKKIEGLLGGILFELIPSLITLFGGSSRVSRLSGL